MVRTCECCGHPMPDDSVQESLTRMQRKLYNALVRAGTRGIPSADIMDAVYGDDPSGGPESYNVVHVMRCQIKDRLAQHGLAIKSRRGPGAIWRLEKINV